MSKIKLFSYLDTEKMYSISAQIFEGLTESFIKSSSSKQVDFKQQDWPEATGRTMADILSTESSIQEKRFMHDYAYNIFEKKLFEDDCITSIDKTNYLEKLDKIDQYSFIKVKGSAFFNDVVALDHMLKNFNKLGEAFTFLKLKEENIANENITDAKIKKASKEFGFHIDQAFLDKLGLLLSYGYSNQFNIQIIFPELIFSTSLKRDFLKENENILVEKYARKSEKDFVIFGVVTQSEKKSIDSRSTAKSNDIKVLVSSLLSSIADLEEKFVGKLENEIIIDPIAVYREL